MTQTLAPPPEPERFKFTVKDFYALADLGLFEDRKVELWDGDIVEMSVNPPHADGVADVHNSFARTFSDAEARVKSQSPLDIGESDKLPQPDVMLLKPIAYVDELGQRRHPKPHEVLLLVEISDSTLAYDKNNKLKSYAKHGIYEYWIADLNSQTWLVYQEPRGEDYTVKLAHPFGTAFAPLALPNVVKVWLAS
jgi:Uma2 family endonuclease